MRQKTWNDTQLLSAVATSTSIAQVIKKLGLVPAGGNYTQVQERIKTLKVDTSHFTGYAWNRGMQGRYLPHTSLTEILVRNSRFQSYKLKIRLFKEGLKNQNVNCVGGVNVQLMVVSP
jgi:hypothetical protein